MQTVKTGIWLYMVRCLFYLLLVVSSTLHAQDTLNITRSFIGSSRIEKVYAVLSTDSTILHGTYTTYHANGRVLQSGTYNQGRRNGYWQSWFDNGQKETETHYTNGKETGIWKYYNYNGSLSCAFNMDSVAVQTISSADLGYIASKLKYPARARDLGIEGDVEAAILVDSNCNITNFTILSYTSEDFRAEIWYQLNHNKQYFQKIVSGSVPCLPMYKIPFRFRLG